MIKRNKEREREKRQRSVLALEMKTKKDQGHFRVDVLFYLTLSHNLSSKWLRIFPERRVSNINEKYFSMDFSIGDYITWSVCRRWDFSDSDKNYHQDLKAAIFLLFHADSSADSLNLFTLFDGLFCFSFVSAILCLPIYACNGITLLHRLVSSESPMVLITLLNCECSLSISNENISSISFSNFYLYLLSFFKNKIASFYFIFSSINACHSFAALFSTWEVYIRAMYWQ